MLHLGQGVSGVAAEQGKVDPMHQFQIEPMFGTDHWEIAGYNLAFTNSALWMAIASLCILVFVRGGMKRDLVPGRWQMAVESMTGFVDSLLSANVGPAGRKYVPYVFSLFMFILFANVLGLLPIGVLGLHPFTFTSHFTATGVLAILSFAIVLGVGFAKHGFHFFSLFIPHGTPAPMIPLIFVIELVSFMVRPFSLSFIHVDVGPVTGTCQGRGGHGQLPFGAQRDLGHHAHALHQLLTPLLHVGMHRDGAAIIVEGASDTEELAFEASARKVHHLEREADAFAQQRQGTLVSV